MRLCSRSVSQPGSSPAQVVAELDAVAVRISEIATIRERAEDRRQRAPGRRGRRAPRRPPGPQMAPSLALASLRRPPLRRYLAPGPAAPRADNCGHCRRPPAVRRRPRHLRRLYGASDRPRALSLRTLKVTSPSPQPERPSAPESIRPTYCRSSIDSSITVVSRSTRWSRG